jgi:hypothetical protein
MSDWSHDPTTGEMKRLTAAGAELRMVPQTFGAGLLTVGQAGDDSWREGWSYPLMLDAIQAFIMWEPGMVTICAACMVERGGDDPPGPWIRQRPSNRRRMPIFGQHPPLVAGWFEYVRA